VGHTLKVRNGDGTAEHFRSAAHGRLPRDRREPCTQAAPLCGPGPRVLLPVTAFFRFGLILSPFLPAVKGWGGKKARFWTLFRLYRGELWSSAAPIRESFICGVRLPRRAHSAALSVGRDDPGAPNYARREKRAQGRMVSAPALISPTGRLFHLNFLLSITASSSQRLL